MSSFESNLSMAVKAFRMLTIVAAISLVGMMVGREIRFVSPITGGGIMVLFGLWLAMQFFATMWVELIVTSRLIRYLLRELWRVTKIIAPPVGVVVAKVLAVAVVIAFAVNPLTRLSWQMFHWAYLAEAGFVTWFIVRKTTRSTWVRVLWNKYAVPAVCLGWCLHQLFMMSAAAMRFTTLAHAALPCDPQPGLHRVVTTCEVRTQVRASIDVGIKGDWWRLLFQTMGITDDLSLDARHSWKSDLANNKRKKGKEVRYLSFSWNQGDKKPTVLAKFDPATGTMLKTWVAYTPFDGVCVGARCAVTSPTERLVAFIDDEKNEVVDAVQFPTFAPSFIARKGESEIVLVLVRMNGSVEVDPKYSLVKGVSPKINNEVTCERNGCRAVAVVNVRTGEVTSWRAWEDPPPAIMSAEFYYATYVQKTDAVQFGVVPALLGLQENGPKAVAQMTAYEAVRSIYFSAGSAYDPNSDLTYVAFPSDGIGVFNQKLRQVDWIKSPLIPMGIRAITVDPSRNTLWVGTYDTGELYAINLITHQVTGPWHVGHRFRQLRYDPALDQIDIASGEGFMYLNPSEIFKSVRPAENVFAAGESFDSTPNESTNIGSCG